MSMVTYNDILLGKESLSVVGLGYVGMPIAVSFAKKVKVIGFDLNKAKVAQYQNGVDPTLEVGDEVIRTTSVCFTTDEEMLRQAKFHIVAVPTPINADTTPDLSPLENASRIVGHNLVHGSIVVFESTVFPGVTEDVCVSILEHESGLRCGVDFKVGYSPERINPGDKIHRLESIVKIVSGMDSETLETIAKVYEMVVEAGVYRAPTIKVAEAAKVIENSQRDINIAFMNELAIIFNKMGIDTLDVLDAASTKWNFLNFKPGLVGGHCIGVDPYYLTYKAALLGYQSQVILAGRRINDSMGKYVAESTIKLLIKAGKRINNCRIGILGFTFKENCPDIRNTRVIDIVNELKEYGVTPLVADPVADEQDACAHYGLQLYPVSILQKLDCVIIAVNHTIFAQMDIAAMLNPKSVVVDVKGTIQPIENHIYWRL